MILKGAGNRKFGICIKNAICSRNVVYGWTSERRLDDYEERDYGGYFELSEIIQYIF